ncbi:hypothetical protein HMI55_002422 [Coelomomyces lativittatus]|nr:hypothetical protein HMI56_005599 [Coelomomyces lativittatus]KAJ1516375.1 hypothetical protein HMI55_002422 [Coelomomyces lativittatus]
MLQSKLSPSTPLLNQAPSTLVLDEFDELELMGNQFFNEITQLQLKLNEIMETNEHQKIQINELQLEVENQKKTISELTQRLSSDLSFDLLSEPAPTSDNDVDLKEVEDIIQDNELEHLVSDIKEPDQMNDQ